MPIKRIPGKRESLQKAIKGLGDAEASVGWFESAKYPDGAPVAGVAAVQEFGSAARSIPPRPFFRTTVAEKEGEWSKTAEKAAQAVVKGQIAPDSMAEALALRAEGDVRRTISRIVDPPLSTLTLLARMHRKKGETVTGKTIGELSKKIDQGPQRIKGVSTKPLVDTRVMINTLSSQVKKK